MSEERIVDLDSWGAEIEAAKESGFSFFESMDCVDNLGTSNTFTIVCRLGRFETAPEETSLAGPDLEETGSNETNPEKTGPTKLAQPTWLTLSTEVPREAPKLQSIAAHFAGANWHQRQIHDFFGVEFLGTSNEPLLNRTGVPHPLRKEVILGARVAREWPGESFTDEQTSARRKVTPPGVPDKEIWGNRDDKTAASPEEIVAALYGGRGRSGRRRR